MIASLKRYWLQLFQFAVWIAAVLTFLNPPPGLHESARDLGRLGIVASTVAATVLLVLCSRWSKKKHSLGWAIGGLLFLYIGLIAFISYDEQRSGCLCEADGNTLLIGEILTKRAADHASLTNIVSCDGLLREFAGVRADVWTPESMTRCASLLVTSYVVVLLAFVCAVIATAQAGRLIAHRARR
jgi:hypothetical protein